MADLSLSLYKNLDYIEDINNVLSLDLPWEKTDKAEQLKKYL